MRKNHRSVVFQSIASTLVILTPSSLVYAATLLHFETTVNVSNTPAATEKGRLVRLAYNDNGYFVKPYVLLYTDAIGIPGGQLNVYVRRSFDEGLTWDGPTLLSRDNGGNTTGGQLIVVQSTEFLADNDKATVFAPQSYADGKPRSILVSWSSSYCPPLDTGQYPNPGQKINPSLIPNQPYKCVWTARSIDAGETWITEQLTDGSLDVINDVATGSQSNDAFALAWQADPAGLQPGEDEGPGDGGSGAHTTAGTNIWYTHSAGLSGSNPLLRNNITQLSDNNSTVMGGPGASRPTLAMSGKTAAIVYEESRVGEDDAGAGVHGGGKNVIYHAFAYNQPDANSAGIIVNDPTKNARRARVVLQGDSAAGTSPLRALVFYRQANVIAAHAPSDIVVHRGLKDTLTDPASTGFRPQDLEPYTAAQNLSDPGSANTNDNAMAHRAIVRGNFIAFGYTHTPDMAAADGSIRAPRQTYDFFVRTSNDAGETWSNPNNLSNLSLPTIAVREPRLVPTPGTIINPISKTPDPNDTQDPNVFYVAFGAYRNDATRSDLGVYVTRSTDLGASYEPLVPLPGGDGQSEAQLRATPDGSSVMVLWMQEIPSGGNRDVMLATAMPIEAPMSTATSSSDDSGNGGCLFTANRRDGGGPIDPTLPALVLGTAMLLALSRAGFNRSRRCEFWSMRRIRRTISRIHAREGESQDGNDVGATSLKEAGVVS